MRQNGVRKGDIRGNRGGSVFAGLRGREVALSSIMNAFDQTWAKRKRFAAGNVGTGMLVMLIGLPASGKSTLTEAFESRGWLRLNKDSIRKELYGDEAILGDPKEVNRVFYERLEAACRQSRRIVVDNLNLNQFYRKGPIATAREHGYVDISNIVLDVPVDECVRRNALRARQVPEAVIRQHAMTLKAGFPSQAEGRLLVLANAPSQGGASVNRNRFVVKRSRAPLIARA